MSKLRAPTLQVCWTSEGEQTQIIHSRRTSWVLRYIGRKFAFLWSFDDCDTSGSRAPDTRWASDLVHSILQHFRKTISAGDIRPKLFFGQLGPIENFFCHAKCAVFIFRAHGVYYSRACRRRGWHYTEIIFRCRRNFLEGVRCGDERGSRARWGQSGVSLWHNMIKACHVCRQNNFLQLFAFELCSASVGWDKNRKTSPIGCVVLEIECSGLGCPQRTSTFFGSYDPKNDFL